MRVISIRQEPIYKETAAKYIHSKWGNETNYQLYESSIFGCVSTTKPLPHWYLLEDDNEIIGCAGLIDLDFISRTDLSPWLCSLFIEENHRGMALGSLLIKQIKKDAAKERFERIYLCTDLNGFYEKYDFHYIGEGFCCDGKPTKIYEAVIPFSSALPSLLPHQYPFLK
ncbi:MAG: GNAT family N-acetyltransferase [Deltaproteobacteria bacterium]